jgi:hypothetical protein
VKHFFGKRRATHRLSTPSVGNFLHMGVLPPTPPAWGWEYKVPNWFMLGNGPDTYKGTPFGGAGDCVVAMAYHLVMMWTANTGNPLIATTDQAIGVYIALTGYDPATGANDTGLDVQAFLDYWKSTGLPCTDSNGNSALHKILGYASIDIHNIGLLNQCTYLFEGIACGIQCPASAEEDTSNWVWVPDSPIVGGHGVPRVGMGTQGGNFISWATRIPHTPEFLVNTLDESYAVVSEDQLNLGKSPAGFDRNGLLNALGNV